MRLLPHCHTTCAQWPRDVAAFARTKPFLRMSRTHSSPAQLWMRLFSQAYENMTTPQKNLTASIAWSEVTPQSIPSFRCGISCGRHWRAVPRSPMSSCAPCTCPCLSPQRPLLLFWPRALPEPQDPHRPCRVLLGRNAGAGWSNVGPKVEPRRHTVGPTPRSSSLTPTVLSTHTPPGLDVARGAVQVQREQQRREARIACCQPAQVAGSPKPGRAWHAEHPVQLDDCTAAAHVHHWRPLGPR